MPIGSSCPAHMRLCIFICAIHACLLLCCLFYGHSCCESILDSFDWAAVSPVERPAVETKLPNQWTNKICDSGFGNQARSSLTLWAKGESSLPNHENSRGTLIFFNNGQTCPPPPAPPCQQTDTSLPAFGMKHTISPLRCMIKWVSALMVFTASHYLFFFHKLQLSFCNRYSALKIQLLSSPSPGNSYYNSYFMKPLIPRRCTWHPATEATEASCYCDSKQT